MYPAYPAPHCHSRRAGLLARTALSGALLVATTAQAASAQQAPTLIQQYYTSAGGVNGGGANAPIISTATPGITSITVNDPRTLIDTTNTNGLSDFHPTISNTFDIHFGTNAGQGNRDWIAIFRSSATIEIDGALRGWLGSGTTETGGNIWLLGANGVVFTNNARVFAGGLLATTANLSSSSLSKFLDPAATQVSFDVLGNSAAGVQLTGSAQVYGNGGTIAFIAPYVSSSSGVVVTDLKPFQTNGQVHSGTQVLYGAAERYTISFARDAGNDFDLVAFEVNLNQNDGSAGNGNGTLIDLAGSTSTTGNIYVSAVNKGQLVSSVVNLGGTLTATKATAGDGNGNIVLSAGGGLDSATGTVSPKTGYNSSTLKNDFVTSTGRVDINAAGAVAGGGTVVVAATGSVAGGDVTAGRDLFVRAGRTLAQSSTVTQPAAGGYGYGYGYGGGPTVYHDPDARAGGVFLTSATAGDDLLISAVNGTTDYGINVGSIHLAGMSDAAGDPLGFDAAGDGTKMLLQTVRDGISIDPNLVQRIAIGGPLAQPNGSYAATGELFGTGNLQIQSAGGAQVEVQGNVRLTSVTAAGLDPQGYDKIDIKTYSGDVTVGSASASAGNVLIDASGSATVTTASAAASAAETGVVSVHGGTGASLGTGTAASDIYVAAEQGAATAGALTAGDDIYVRAAAGPARLTSATMTRGGADANSSTDLSPGLDQNNNPIPLIPAIGDSANNGRVVQVQGVGAAGDVYLGLGTGGVSFAATGTGANMVNVLAGNDAFLSSPTVRADTLTAGRDIVLSGTSFILPSLTSARDLTLTASGGFSTPVSFTAARDLTLATTAGGLSVSGATTAGRSLTASGATSASLASAQAGDDLSIVSSGAINVSSLRTTRAMDAAGDGSNITLAGASVSASTVNSADDFTARVSGALTLGSGGGGFAAGRDVTLAAASFTLPAIAAGRDLSLSTSNAFANSAALSATRDLAISAGDTTLSGVSAVRDMRLSGTKLTLASLMIGRDGTLSAGSGGLSANQAIAPGRDLTVRSAGDATFGTAAAGDDIRITSTGKVTASKLTAGGGADSEADGYNIIVTGQSTAIASAAAPGTVSITPAPPSAPVPTPTPTPTPTPPASPWVQAYYGGAVGANGAPTFSTANPGVLDITLNASRTLTDWGATNGVSDFHPSAAQAVRFHFAQSDWIAIVRSGGQIQVDGQLQALIGNSSTVGGNLWLMSGAGVLFTGNARVDVGGLLATSASFSSMADALDPAKTSFTFNTPGSGAVTIQGGARITGTGGVLAFVGPSVTSAAGATVSGTGGTSAVYAATGTATLGYARTATGNLGFASANGDFATGPVALAGTTSVDGSATLGGTVLSVASLTAGGPVTMLATNGGIGVSAMTTPAAATFNATGKVALGDVAAGDASVVAADLDIATGLGATSLTAQSTGGDMFVGGGDGTGFRVTGDEIGRMKLARGASFYAGLTGSAAGRGNLVVGDMSYDPANLPELDLYADTGHTVSVTGAVRPLSTGGIVQIGDSLTNSGWRPSSIGVSGSLGSAIIYSEKCFDQVVSVGELRMFAVNDIVFGSSAFQAAVASTPAASIDVARRTPSTGEAGGDHLFAVVQKLTMSASGKIVQQNTASTSGPTVGLLLANQDNVTNTVLSIAGAPKALDLFGSLIDANGVLRSSINAAGASELRVSGATAANYRFNGCALANAAACSILSTTSVSGAQTGSSFKREPVDDADDGAAPAVVVPVGN